MAIKNVEHTELELRALRARNDRACERIKVLQLPEQVSLLREFIKRAIALCGMTRAVLLLNEDERPAICHIAKTIETALFNAEEAQSLCSNQPMESPLFPLDTTIDRASGVLAMIDAWLWSDGWDSIPDAQLICGSLDAASDVLAEVDRSLVGIKPTAATLTTH
jgi:hypothetical protein